MKSNAGDTLWFVALVNVLDETVDFVKMFVREWNGNNLFATL